MNNHISMIKLASKLLLLTIFSILLFSEANADADQLRADVEKLASDEFMGRRPGTDGIEMAAKLIEDRFQKLGLDQVSGSYRQTFDVVENLEIGEANELAVSMIIPRRGIPKERLKPVTRKLKLGEDYTPFYYSGNGSVNAELAFAGFGITNPNAGYDDYQGIDVKNKIVVILTGTPEGEVSTNNFQGQSDPLYKIENAQAQGAAGVILLGMKGDSANVLPKMVYMEVVGKPNIPVVFAQRKKIEKFFPNSHSLITLENKIVETKKPSSMILEDRSANITVELKDRIIQTSNIIGVVEGTEDPDEYIVIGAHYDHLGTAAMNSMKKGSYGHIHNGADDNASGTALMLEMADIISKSPVQKSVMFIAFSSEEMGLLGSNYFVENPSVELDNIMMMINLDMVGMYKDSLTVFGTGSAAGLDQLVNEAAALADINTKNVNIAHGPSDHLHFYRNSIPVVHLFTGLHPHFHKPSDDVENLNYEGINQIGNFVRALVSGLSIAEIEFINVEAGSEDDYHFGEMPITRRPSGIFNSYSYNKDGLELIEVVRNSRAWKAGIRPGDIITKINGRNVNSTTAIRYNMVDMISRSSAEKLQAGVPIDITLLRDGKEVTVQLEI